MADQGIRFDFEIDFSQPLKAVRAALDDTKGAAVTSLEPLVQPVMREIRSRMPQRSGRMKQALRAKKVLGRRPGWVFIVDPSNAGGYRTSERGHVARAIFQDGGTIDHRKKRKSPPPKQRTGRTVSGRAGVKAEKFMVKGKNAAAPPRVTKIVVEKGMRDYMKGKGFLVA